MVRKAPGDTGRDSLNPVWTVRLPGFLIDEPLGVGDIIKRATNLAGIKPCTGCTRRAFRLNRWLQFYSRR
jgi:hypothetical protein